MTQARTHERMDGWPAGQTKNIMLPAPVGDGHKILNKISITTNVYEQN